MEPIIQPGNEGLVHHIIVYGCYGDVDLSELGRGHLCGSASMPTVSACTALMLGWAIGGEVSITPSIAIS